MQKWLLAALFGWMACVQAAGVDGLINRSEQLRLATQPGWLALIHYKQSDPRHAEQNSSYVDDEKFFLAKDGANNPQAELIATLRAIVWPTGLAENKRNHHPRCRFPARYNWLAQQLGIALSTFGVAECPEYRQWREQINAGKVTLVYAASHLNSPSSMYGHTLLRLDSASADSSSFLSSGVSFGADIPPGDGSIIYAYKGIFGGYPGKFNVLAYLEKIKDYNKVENRDLWEYELNLNSEETERLATHLWELKDMRFDYFFFDENCSYRLLELLEFARPGVELTDSFTLFAIPADTVRVIEDAGFVRSKKRRPSKANIIVHQLGQLTEQERLMTAQLIENPAAALQNQTLLSQPPTSQARSVKTALDFLNYKFRKTDRQMGNVDGRFLLLQTSSQLPKAEFTPIETPTAPEDGHESSLLSTAIGRANNLNTVDITLRASFHDLLDNLPGYDKGAAINIAGITLRHEPDGSDLTVNAIDIVDIHSFSVRNDLFKPISWEVEFGAETRQHGGGDRLVPQLNASGGVSYALWGNNISYFLLGARTELNSELFSSDFGLAAQGIAGSLVYSRIGTTQLQWISQYFTNGYRRYDTELRHNIPLGKDLALRLNFNHADYQDIRFNEFSLELRYFF